MVKKINDIFTNNWASLVAQSVKNPPTIKETTWNVGDTTHSSILAWETPWTEEPGRLQFMELQGSGMT